MVTKVKFLSTWGDFAPGDFGQVEEDGAKQLIEQGIAVAYDEVAERKAAELKEAERLEVVKMAVDAMKGILNEPAHKGSAVVQRIQDRHDPAADFKSLGDFALSVKGWQDGQRDDKRLLSWLTKAADTGLTEGVDSEGGFLVPEEFSAEVLRKAYDAAGIVDRCRQVPMTSKAIKFPYVKESSRADGSRQGGIRAYRAAELGALSSSKPTFGMVRLEVEKLYVYVPASEEILMDAAAVGSLIGEFAAEELAFKMDDEVINGTGAAEPLGILTAPCTVSVAKETGQAATTILVDNIMKMWSRCYGRSRANAVWVINQDIEPQLFSMSMAVGTGGVPVYMPANGISGQPYSTLMGRPIVTSESCPTLGTVGDIMLCDFSQYLYARHVSGINAATSIHLKFDYDQTIFRFIVRTDGQPWWSTALTPKSGSANTLSPFVTLATRA